MLNNSVRNAAVLIGLSIAMSGVSDANATTACTGDVATSKNPASIIPVIILSSGSASDDCDANAATTILVTDPTRSGNDTSSSVSDTSSSAQFDPSQGNGGANFSPNFPLSGLLPQSGVVNAGSADKSKSPGPSDIPVVTGSQGVQTTAGGKAGSQGSQTTAEGKAGSQGGKTTADSNGGSQSGQTTAGTKGGSQGSQTTAGSKGGSQGGQTTAGSKAGSQGGQTTAGDKAGSQGGQTTAGGKGGSKGDPTTAGGKGGSQGGQTTAGDTGGSKGDQTTAGGNAGWQGDQTTAGGSGSQVGQTTAGGNAGSQGDPDPVLTSLTSLSVASTVPQSSNGTDQSLPLMGDPATQAATPLPAALPLFAAGIGGLGLLGWRIKRRARVVLT